MTRTWGLRRSYALVEDGDRKGNQSNKGLCAKQAAKIKAETLPPRSPCFMPLDFAIWKAVLDRMISTMPTHNRTETKKEFLARLKKAAKTLPKGIVAKAIDKMKEQVEGVVDAKGYHPKCD